MNDHILSKDVYGKIYFSARSPGTVDLVIDPDIRYAQGPITLSVAAAEDLMPNLQVNSELARGMASETHHPAGSIVDPGSAVGGYESVRKRRDVIDVTLEQAAVAQARSCVHDEDPEQCPSCACRADHGLPTGNQSRPKLSTNFNNPSLQLHWEIEGIAAIEVEQTMAAHRYNISSVWVDPEYQRLGIGTALMKIVLHEADKVGIELWLVPQAMPGMQRELHDFYSRLGFEGLGGSGYMIRKSPTAKPE